MPASYGNLSTGMIDIALVCVGDRYDPGLYVVQIQRALHRYLSEQFQITVLTDNPDHPVYVEGGIRALQVPNWEGCNPWWYKMYLFAPEMQFLNRVFYLDLDVVVRGSLDKFVNWGSGFRILQDFNRKWLPDYSVSNSSVMMWEPSEYYDIWYEFGAARKMYQDRFRGDQDYLTHYFRERSDLHWWPRTWAQSFKWEIYRGGLIESGTGLDEQGRWPAHPLKYHVPDQPWVLPDDCSIVVFHGEPKPWDTQFGMQHKL